MDLSQANAYGELTNENSSDCGSPMHRVIANSSANSILYKRCVGGACGTLMSGALFGGSSSYGTLTNNDVALIKLWIDSGAN